MPDIPTVDSEVMKSLQAILRAHWTAIEFYETAAKHLKRWGYRKLGKNFSHEAKDERQHLHKIIKRIEYYDGSPVYIHSSPPTWQRHDVLSILRTALAIENEARTIEDTGAVVSRAKYDEMSARMFGHIIKDTEATIKWLTGLLDLAEKLGTQNFLQEMV